ncbi:MAG: glycosyltransferase 87 family protein, partial [Rikenellaceae bacterium]
VSAGLLFVSIKYLPIERWKHAVILWFIINELFTAACMQQFNIMIGAFIILTFVLVEKNRNFWAAFFIVLGTLTKLYGVVGLVFFLFSHNKSRFISALIFWGAILYLLPILISSHDFVNNSYIAWITDILSKNELNYFTSHQNISLLGVVRKVSQNSSYSDLQLIIPGIILYGSAFLRTKQYEGRDFRLLYLASTLLFTVLFSTGSESSSYIIAFTGVMIWFTSTHSKTKKLNIALLVFAILLTSLSPTDIFPKSIRINYIYPYALKALPCVLIWFKICYELLTCNFITKNPLRESQYYHTIDTNSIDIILPCYNPHSNWVDVVCMKHNELQLAFPTKKINMIVVNDGSKYNFTPEYTDKLKSTIPTCKIVEYFPNMGKGHAIREGVKASCANIVIYTDTDFPYTLESMHKVIDKLNDGYDIVIATRNKTYYNALSISRKMMSWGTRLLNQVIMNLKYSDTQGGLKGMSRKGCDLMLTTKVNRFLFDTEFVVMASRRRDISITEISANLRDGIILPNMSFKVVRREFMNFLRIMFK